MSVQSLVTLIDGAQRFDHDNGGRRDTALRLTWPKDYGPAQAPQTIVAGLLEAGTFAGIYGPSNSGKSTLALDIALTVARGAPWRGRRTAGGLALYLGLESPAGLRRRVMAYQKHHGLPPVACFCDIGETVQLLDPADLERLLEAIRRAEAAAASKCVLIVVDTLARAMAGHDENATLDMGAFVGACDRVRQATGATVLVVHHSGKDPTKGARGSNSLRAAFDTEIEVSSDSNPRQARVTKQRDLPGGEVLAFNLEPVELGLTPDTAEPITACVVVHSDQPAAPAPVARGKAVVAILRVMRAQQEAHHKAGNKGPVIWSLEDIRQIGRNLNQHRNTAREAADRLIVSGLTVPTIGGHRLAEVDHERT